MTDSTSYPLVSDAFTGNEQAVTVYRASDKEALGGHESIPLETSSRYSRSGSASRATKELEMTGLRHAEGCPQSLGGRILVSAQGRLPASHHFRTRRRPDRSRHPLEHLRRQLALAGPVAVRAGGSG